MTVWKTGRMVRNGYKKGVGSMSFVGFMGVLQVVQNTDSICSVLFFSYNSVSLVSVVSSVSMCSEKRNHRIMVATPKWCRCHCKQILARLKIARRN